MKPEDYKKAKRCVTELYLNVNNQRLRIDSESYSYFQSSVPLYELLNPQSGDFSLCFWFENHGSFLISEVPVGNVGLFLKELNKSLNLKEGDSITIKMDEIEQNFIIRHELSGAVVYRSNLKPGKNCTYDFIYEVPWQEFVNSIELLQHGYTSLIQSVAHHVSKYFNEKPLRDTLNGLELTARVNSKSPVIGDSLQISVEIKNISEKAIELVNNFEPSYHNFNPTIFDVNGNYCNGILKKPISLKPGESYTLSGKIAIDRFETTLQINYFSTNDLTCCTNMPFEMYLKVIGDHYDISDCWQGELKTEISLMVRAGNWREKIYPEVDFEEWLRKKSGKSVLD